MQAICRDEPGPSRTRETVGLVPGMLRRTSMPGRGPTMRSQFWKPFANGSHTCAPPQLLKTHFDLTPPTQQAYYLVSKDAAAHA